MCTCMWCLYRYVVYKFVYVYFSLRQGTLHSWLYGRDQQWIPVPKRNTKKKGQISGTGVGKPLSGTKLGHIDITREHSLQPLGLREGHSCQEETRDNWP